MVLTTREDMGFPIIDDGLRQREESGKVSASVTNSDCLRGNVSLIRKGLYWRGGRRVVRGDSRALEAMAWPTSVNGNMQVL